MPDAAAPGADVPDPSDPTTTRLEYFACGETSHDMGLLTRGGVRGRRVFPSGAFLWTSATRRVLFDTGYAPLPWRAGPAAWAYRRLLPPTVPAGATIAEQVDPATVTHVVLSHLHPDHVGGLRSFPHATLVLSEGVARTLGRPRLRDGVLRRLLPDGFDVGRATVVSDFVDGPFGLRVADPFADDRYLLVDLPGHARGHLGALVEGRVVLAGDAAWGRDLLGHEARLRAVPRLVAHDGAAQARTARSLLAAERSGARLLLAHDPHPTRTDLL
ncbi:MBL fold metallo-hydrolase [Frigoribacterium sp. MCBA15_019]|uniref:MBL fold metallo-hydrolase n=1 Tax=Frigoribacterium sp. MCBA15_019 TaxID=1898745 RepID=UPI0008DCA800|nr:MBL fold metallo-hydrolase [Frigoribacterium sp. MCBA15_019]OII22099.1 hypothetical protein BIV04_09605 [Frigoribacterium sp. MCBA15_019]